MNTTISISKDLRDKIKKFGNKGDTYTDILNKLYKSAKERELHDLLMNDDDCIPIETALKRAKER